MRASFAVVFLVMLFIQAHAQAPAWGGGNDQHSIDFGFNFQYVSSQYKIFKKADWQTPYIDPQTGQQSTAAPTILRSPASPGFGVGFVSRLKLHDNVDLRFTPSLLFVDRNLEYYFEGNDPEMKKITVQSTGLDIPLALKLKTDRLHNVRAYLIGGVKYSTDIGKRKDDRNEAPLERLVKNRRGYFSYETGIGFDIYFEYFKMSPEIRLARSFGNVLEPEDHPYSKPIDQLLLHNVVFSLLFE